MLWLQDGGQFLLEFLWGEINGRDLVPPHDLIEIPSVELQELGGFSLRDDVLTQQLHHKCFPHTGGNFTLRPAKSCHHFFREHDVKVLICHRLSFGKCMYMHEAMVPRVKNPSNWRVCHFPHNF